MFWRAGLFAFVVLIFGCTVATAQQDPFVGTWKQNLAKSKYDPVSLAPKTGTTLHREAAGNNAYKNTTDGADAQGAPTHTEDTVKLDGNDYPVKGANWDTVSAKKLDANTVITVDKKGGTVVRMGRTIVSKDGKTCTSEYLGYNAKGVAFHTVIVWEKQ